MFVDLAIAQAMSLNQVSENHCVHIALQDLRAVDALNMGEGRESTEFNILQGLVFQPCANALAYPFQMGGGVATPLAARNSRKLYGRTVLSTQRPRILLARSWLSILDDEPVT